MMLPRVVCMRREFGELSADPTAAPWAAIAPIELREAATGAAPKQRTQVRTAWSEGEWRVLFTCEDADPWATLTVRDGPLYQEETVEVFFDPVGDLESYYEIEVNPLGTELDIVFRRSRSGYKGDWAWDCAGLRTLARVAVGAWFVEMAIPFSAVGNAAPGAEWRVNFCRIDRPARGDAALRELSAWSPPMRLSFHTPERYGVVAFAAGV